jgi:hypothetical protein
VEAIAVPVEKTEERGRMEVQKKFQDIGEKFSCALKTLNLLIQPEVC